MKQVSFKLIFRSWKRNKTFAVISILSLAVGIACTNLLAALVIHEYNVEAGNPMKDRIVVLQEKLLDSDYVMTFWMREGIQEEILTRVPELDATCNVNEPLNAVHCQKGEEFFTDFKVLETDSVYFRFFPQKVLAGSLADALQGPDRVVLNETFAKRLFGREEAVGQMIRIQYKPLGYPGEKSGTISYTVSAVVKDRDQGAFVFDVLLLGAPTGGMNLYSLKEGVSIPELKMKTDSLIIPNRRDMPLQYSFSGLRESSMSPHFELAFLVKRDARMLRLAFISALLILLIACFNYVNLSFSRVFKQLHAIHVQKLMGAGSTNLGLQLFADTFLTVSAGFLISLLIQYDLLSVVNRIMSVQMPASFLYSSQVLPVTLGFTFLLALIPSVYMSRKLPSLSLQTYNRFYTGKGKQRIVAVLAVIQFAVSIALVMGTVTVRRQLSLLYEGVEMYEDLYSFSTGDSEASMLPLKERVELLPGIHSLALGISTPIHIFGNRFRYTENGESKSMSFVLDGGDEGLISALGVKQLQGIPWEEAIERYANPIFLNETYARQLFPSGELPVGDPLKAHDFRAQESELGNSIIAGVVENYNREKVLEDAVHETIIKYSRDGTYLLVRFDPARKAETIRQIQKEWDRLNPGVFLQQKSVRDGVLDWNRKIIELSDLLLMYSLISLFLTCFGLFGMSLYVIEQRTKEIGIRKVNGATSPQIIWLLLRRFLVWIGLAFGIAVPVTWYLMNRWLETFILRKELTFAVCLLAGFVVLCVSLLTIVWHSYRAASGNPVNTLRSE